MGVGQSIILEGVGWGGMERHPMGGLDGGSSEHQFWRAGWGRQRASCEGGWW